MTAGINGAARIWDAQLGSPLTPPMMPGSELTRAIISSDGARVLTLGGTFVRLWNATTGLPIGAALQHTTRVLDAAFSPDGRRIVSGDLGGTVRLWDAGDGRSWISHMVCWRLWPV